MKMPKILQRDEKGNYGVMWEGVMLELVSVTTILNRAMKHSLLYFYGKYGNDEAKKIALEAAQVGTDSHAYFEAFFRGDASVATTGDLAKIKNCINNFRRFVEICKPDPVLIDGDKALELTVFSITHKFAGTFDGLFKIIHPVTKKPMVVIVDWKTSSGIYDDYWMQIEAYYRALTEMVERGILKLDVKIDGLALIRFAKEELFDASKDILILEPGNEARWQGFLGLAKYNEWCKTKKKFR